MENINVKVEQAKQHLKKCQARAREEERIKIANETQLEQLRTQEEAILKEVKSLGYKTVDELAHTIEDKMKELEATLQRLDQLLRGEIVKPVQVVKEEVKTESLAEDLTLPEFEPSKDEDDVFDDLFNDYDDDFGGLLSDDDDFM